MAGPGKLPFLDPSGGTIKVSFNNISQDKGQAPFAIPAEGALNGFGQKKKRGGQAMKLSNLPLDCSFNRSCTARLLIED
jgi:hypothetical protein